MYRASVQAVQGCTELLYRLYKALAGSIFFTRMVWGFKLADAKSLSGSLFLAGSIFFTRMVWGFKLAEAKSLAGSLFFTRMV